MKELVGTDGFVDIYSDDAVSKLEKLPNTYKTKIGELLQLDEELKKIQLINGNNCSEEVLSKLEKLWIFQGNIGCLLNCDGIILDDSLAQIISHMNGSVRSQYLRNIEGNMGNVLSMFRAVLAVSEHDTLPEELLLNDEHNRFRILLNGSLMDPFRTMLEKLRGLFDSAGSYSPEQERYSADIVGNNVRSIIDSIGENVPYWIYALVKIPELWNMSERGKIKKEHREGNEGYYLYRKVRMNENDIFLEKDNVKSLLSL